MSARIKEIIDEIIRVEGDFVDDPDDRGGATRFGITIAVARAWGYRGEMKDLPRQMAFDIYLSRYVQTPQYDKVIELSPKLGEELVDTGVNMGPAVATMFLQRWLNALSGSKLFVDGRLGPMSIGVLQKYIKSRRAGESELILFRALNSLQAVRYLELAEKNPSQGKFLNGWLLNRVS